MRRISPNPHRGLLQMDLFQVICFLRLLSPLARDAHQASDADFFCKSRQVSNLFNFLRQEGSRWTTPMFLSSFFRLGTYSTCCSVRRVLDRIRVGCFALVFSASALSRSRHATDRYDPDPSRWVCLGWAALLTPNKLVHEQLASCSCSPKISAAGSCTGRHGYGRCNN